MITGMDGFGLRDEKLPTIYSTSSGPVAFIDESYRQPSLSHAVPLQGELCPDFKVLVVNVDIAAFVGAISSEPEAGPVRHQNLDASSPHGCTAMGMTELHQIPKARQPRLRAGNHAGDRWWS